MRGRYLLLMIAFVTAVLVSSCASAPPERDRFYRLSDPQPLAREFMVSESVLEIGRFSARELLESERYILERGANAEITWQQNALWVEPPARMIRRGLLHYLRGLGLFQQVVSHEQQVIAQYRLLGMLLAFERSQDLSGVLIDLDVSLIDLADRKVVLAKRFQVNEAAVDTSVSAAVAAFDRALASLAADVAAAIRDAVR